MSGINYKSQINMPVPPTEDTHLMRKQDVEKHYLGKDFLYEYESRMEFLEHQILGLGGSLALAEPILHYDALETLRYIMERDGLTNEDAIAYLNSQTEESFHDLSASGSHAILQNNVVWNEYGAQVNTVATDSYIALPIGNVNAAILSDNYTVMTAMTMREVNRRNNWFGDYNQGINAAFELRSDNTLRWYHAGNPDLIMPKNTWSATAGKPLYMAVSVKRTGNDFELDMYIDGVQMWHYAFVNATVLANREAQFWWGNDRRQSAEICTRGNLHALRVYDKHLSNYEVLKFMQDDMKRYG